MATVGALLTLTAPAHAEPAKAGPFWEQGMYAMWDIGLLLPGDEARIQIRSCRVTPQKAVCALRVAVRGLERCKVTAVFQRHDYRLPERLWGCPAEWRPATFRPTATERLLLEKGLAR